MVGWVCVGQVGGLAVAPAVSVEQVFQFRSEGDILRRAYMRRLKRLQGTNHATPLGSEGCFRRPSSDYIRGVRAVDLHVVHRGPQMLSPHVKLGLIVNLDLICNDVIDSFGYP